MKNAEYRDENIGLLGHKPPYFVVEKSDVSTFPGGKPAENSRNCA